MNAAIKYPFPGVTLQNFSQFSEYKKSHSLLLDHRYSTEQFFAGGDDVIVEGICPLRKQRTHFVSPTGHLPLNQAGKRVPEWRDAQTCDWGIRMADRSCAHYAIYSSLTAQLGRVLLLSRSEALVAALETYATSVTSAYFPTADMENFKFDTILVVNSISECQDLDEYTDILHNNLADGGKLYLSFNFYYNSFETEKHIFGDNTYWSIGWDIFDRLMDAGFQSPLATTFWAEELGYLGPHNFVLEARK